MTKDVLLDADIREPLFEYLEMYYGKVRFLEEKVTGKATVNEKLSAKYGLLIVDLVELR